MSSYSLPPLDPRLALIASMVPPGTAVADIGTDHGYLPVYLVKSGKCPRAVACDINPQPLEKARTLIAQQGLSGQIATLLTNGLQGLEAYNPQVIVLAGMGGELISVILEESAAFVRQPGVTLLLQPMTRPEALREYLSRHGFAILEEHGTAAGKHLYSVIKAAYTGEKQLDTPLFYYTGGLPDSGRSQSAECIRKTLAVLRQRIAGMERSRRTGNGEELSLLKKLTAEIETLLEEL